MHFTTSNSNDGSIWSEAPEVEAPRLGSDVTLTSSEIQSIARALADLSDADRERLLADLRADLKLGDSEEALAEFKRSMLAVAKALATPNIAGQVAL